MSHNISSLSQTASLSQIKRITQKETALFFSSPIAYIFLAIFIGVSLFIFFWAEAFFSRNISDVSPLFSWMPVLLIFLSSALTMKLWSEERRTGTLEHVLTQPTPLWHFVVGKFLACLFLLGVALMITLPLPITVSIIGQLDWGPVFAGYLATFFLGAAYLSIGLFVSSRCDNQIISLILTTLICSLLYLIGSPLLTDLLGHQAGEWLRLLGTGSRFDAITRGVISIADFYYYMSIIMIFLTLNVFFIEKSRWTPQQNKTYHTHWRRLSFLFIVNAILGNLWIHHIKSLRFDVTEGRQYSISQATQHYLHQLKEPLLIRGYFSSKTHPLLSPLVPQLRNLIQEYEIAGDGNIRIEFIDPMKEPELEEEASKKYGIQPVPFQMNDRYQSSIVSSYFNVLVQYGDEYQILSFQDLIEIKVNNETDMDVQLRNPEHDLTRAIKKVLHHYQAAGNLFDTIKGNLTFTGYVSSDDQLPQELITFKQTIETWLQEKVTQSQERLSVSWLDPEANHGEVAEQIASQYGFQPMATDLFSDQRFYFYLIVSNEDKVIQIPLDDLEASSFERNFDAAIKRFSSGFTKTIALITPSPETSPYGPQMSGAQFNQLENFLSSELNIQREDISDGIISGETDIVLLIAPESLDDKQVFAIDQFLMQGGTVLITTSSFSANLSSRSFAVKPHTSGLTDWLAHHGITIENQLLLDAQNSAFPIPVNRDLGGFQVQEIQMLDYPFFPDLRDSELNQDNPISANIPQLTLTWPSPMTIDSEKQKDRKVIPLIHSSNNAWLSESTDVMPKVDTASGEWHPTGETQSYLLSAVVQGRFNSFFKDKPSPLLEDKQKQEEDKEGLPENSSTPSNEAQTPNDHDTLVSSMIERSPESSRLIVISSNDFLQDQMIGLSGTVNRSEYLNSMQFIANAIDWSLEDAGLLSIRSRSHFNRTLPPMERQQQVFWEYLNYVLALLALILVFLVQKYQQRHKIKRYKQFIAH